MKRSRTLRNRYLNQNQTPKQIHCMRHPRPTAPYHLLLRPYQYADLLFFQSNLSLIVYHLIKLRAPTSSPVLNSCATSTFSGLSGSALVSSWCILVMVLEMVYAGVHAVLSRSRQISPVLKSTLGWQMGVTKRMVGGERGYCEGIEIERSQQPSMKY